MTKCSYCERELNNEGRLKLQGRYTVGEDEMRCPFRVVCGDCVIAVFDAVLRPEVVVST